MSLTCSPMMADTSATYVVAPLRPRAPQTRIKPLHFDQRGSENEMLIPSDCDDAHESNNPPDEHPVTVTAKHTGEQLP